MFMRRALLASGVLAFLVTGLPACAAGNLVDVQILDRSDGHLLPPYRHRGSSYIVGQPGNRYAVQLTNRTGARVLVVLSIDGVNAVSGETAEVGQTGYVLAPFQSTEVTGWRKGWTEAAAFYFTALADSYAARTGRPDNVGVIGAAVFRERVPVAEPFVGSIAPDRSRAEGRAFAANGGSPDERAASADAAANRASLSQLSRSTGAAPSPATAPAQDRIAPQEAERREKAAMSERLGTGHGEREYSPVSQTAFERATPRPADVVRVRYDSYANLLALGVVGPRRESLDPQPFASFTPDPR
ncbi:MAG: hypothetical protein ABIV63_03320 [Caldimonas sp.]